jgi:AraC family transcriptional activator FtrA
MPWIGAKFLISYDRAMKGHLIAALVHPPLSAFEVGCVVEVFGLKRPEVAGNWYDFAIGGLEPGIINEREGQFALEVRHDLELFRRAQTIVVPYWDSCRPAPEPILEMLRAAKARGARLLSICSGAFLLAEAGLLAGRRATTHWLYADRLQRLYPEVEVDAQVLYVDEGDIITSAGSAAGLDMMLHVVRRDHGARICNLIARRINIPPHREGGQSQFISRPVPSIEESRLSRLIEWMRAHSTDDLSIAKLAGLAAMSPRTFYRRFRQSTGLTPYDWLLQERIGIAKELLEAGRLGVDQIAAEAGFGAAQTFRLHFRRVVGTTPSQYRRTFLRGEASDASGDRMRARA